MLTLRAVITQDDFISVGASLGMDWGDICEEIQAQDFCAHDGDGSFTVYRDEDYGDGMINKIISTIFNEYPDLNKFDLIN